MLEAQCFTPPHLTMNTCTRSTYLTVIPQPESTVTSPASQIEITYFLEGTGMNVSPLLACCCNKICLNFRQIVFCNISSWRDFPSALYLITKLVGKNCISALSAQCCQELSASSKGSKMHAYALKQGHSLAR